MRRTTFFSLPDVKTKPCCKEVCALAGQLKDTRQRYKDDRNDLLADLDNAKLDANELVDVMQQRILLLSQTIEHKEAGHPNTLDCVVVEHTPTPKRSND